MLPLLSRYSTRGARAYLGLRILECAAIVSLGVYTVATARELADYELVIYSLAGLGGILVPALHLRSDPACAVTARRVRLRDAARGRGGLFELILPLLLFVKGFSAPASASSPSTFEIVPVTSSAEAAARTAGCCSFR